MNNRDAAVAASITEEKLRACRLCRYERAAVLYLLAVTDGSRRNKGQIQDAIEMALGEPVSEGVLNHFLWRLVEVEVLASVRGRKGGYWLDPDFRASLL